MEFVLDMVEKKEEDELAENVAVRASSQLPGLGVKLSGLP